MKYTIRISSLNTWNRCEAQAMADLDASLLQDEAGPAADTGTALSFAIEQFHKLRLAGRPIDFDTLMNLTKDESERKDRPFEKARWRDVENIFDGYINDKRNLETIVLPEVPLKTTFYVEGDEITLIGTVDQIRVVDGKLEIWDLKSGQKDGQEMLYDYWPQLFGYTLAAREGGIPYNLTFPRECYTMDIRLGGVMRLKEYIEPLPRAGKKVFYPMNNSYRVIEANVRRIANRIVELRKEKSQPTVRPGINCSWCKLGSFEGCSLIV